MGEWRLKMGANGVLDVVNVKSARCICGSAYCPVCRVRTVKETVASLDAERVRIEREARLRGYLTNDEDARIVRLAREATAIELRTADESDFAFL